MTKKLTITIKNLKVYLTREKIYHFVLRLFDIKRNTDLVIHFLSVEIIVS